MVYRTPIRPDELYHHGVKGMHWGQRRFQNPDGSLTPAGMQRYGRMEKKYTALDAKNKKLEKQVYKLTKKTANQRRYAEHIHEDYDMGGRNKAMRKSAKVQKKAAKINYKADRLDRSGDTYKAAQMRAKADKLRYKQAKYDTKANSLSRSTPYGKKAMRELTKSDKYAAKAAKAIAKISKNTRIMEAMNVSMSEVRSQYNYQKYVDSIYKQAPKK